MTTNTNAGKSKELVFQGELLIQRVAELKQELQQALDAVDELMVNLVETPDIDLSCMQVLCSAHRTACKMNKELKLAGIDREALQKPLRRGGLPPRGSCPEGIAASCLWAEMDETNASPTG